jgi:hypothetical protein
MILALRVANSPSVLCQTLRCGLPAGMILQKNNQQDLPKIIQTDQILVSSKRKSGIITAVKWIFHKLHLVRTQYSPKYYENKRNPNTANMQFLFSKTFPK